MPIVISGVDLLLWHVLHQGFHHLVRRKLNRAISVGSSKKVCPLKDFGEAELVKRNDNRTHRPLAANDEDFDGFTIRVRIAMEFEGEFDVVLRLALSLADGEASCRRLALHRNCQPLGRLEASYPT